MPLFCIDSLFIMRANGALFYTLLLYCALLTVIFLHTNLRFERKIVVSDNLDHSWKESQTSNFSFLKLNTGVAIEGLDYTNAGKIVLSQKSTDFEIAESFPESFPLSGGLSRPIPRYKLGNITRNKTIVAGICSIKREGTEYLTRTITSLFFNLSPEEKDLFGIVIFLSEEDDDEYVLERISDLKESFKSEIDAGNLEIISPSPSYYPSDWFKVIRPSFGDSVDRVKWRSKQNLDQMFLMMYVFHLRSEYYLMLEDDVIANRHFVTSMIKASTRAKVQDWFYMSFCRLGAIGKLFRTSVLPSYTAFVQTFWNAKPLDWLQVDFIRTRICGYDEDLKQCNRRLGKYTPQFQPSLFQHIGKISSLHGKIQNLKDNGFRIL